jgi:exopolyphosphatase/guanosine-5'-triphosphate,3'-diphosphate pyrophosphatase
MSVLPAAGRRLRALRSTPTGMSPGEMSAADQREAALNLLGACPEHEPHARQVARLALMLFNELVELHGMGERERFLLECAALLHDIGWINGQPRHHKTSLHIILDTPLLFFDERQRLVIGSIARYHRRALPRSKHRHYAELEPEERLAVRVLAGILRVADALDVRHVDAVSDLRCTIDGDHVAICCQGSGSLDHESTAVRKKGSLLEKVLGRKLVLTRAPEGAYG